MASAKANVERKRNILILGQARTGSSALLGCLVLHPEIKGIGEPFHPRRRNRVRYMDQVHDVESFSTTMNGLLEQYQCIKHMQKHIPLDYHRPLLRQRNLRFVFLHRRNRLQQAVSALVSAQAGSWGGRGEKRREEKVTTIRNASLEPIPIPKLQKRLQAYSRLTNEFRGLLEEAEADYLSLSYEELYASDVAIDRRIQIVEEILASAGYDTSLLQEDPYASALHARLGPRYKTGGEDLYRRIPNCEEIERELGSEATGHLFDGHAT